MSEVKEKIQPKEIKLQNGYVNPNKSGLEYGFGDILGLLKVFQIIRQSNPKIAANVDYWLAKNEKLIGKAWDEYLGKEMDLIKVSVKLFKHNDFDFIPFKGKDENDIIYKNEVSFFKLVDNKLEEVTNPFWELEIPATEEGKEPTKQTMRYQIKFESDEDGQKFSKELEELQQSMKFNIELYRLKEDHLEGLNIVWNTKGENLSEFRNLLYENCIKQTI